MAKGVSQQELGSALGVTFQQIQKYERGENRISLGHLQKIADRFGLPIATFCECMEKGARGVGAAQTDYSLLQSYGSLKLLRRYNSLAPDLRKVVVRLVDALAAKHSGGNRKALSARWGGTPNAGARRREGG
jgi:transcriptional regulator with XRE-family HTH domain